MTDIFQEWKDTKFLVADSKLCDTMDENLIILTDVEYWNDNYEKLKEWCKEIGDGEVRGMTFTCNETTLTAFALKFA